MKRSPVYVILLLLVISCQKKEAVVQDFYASDLFRDVQLAAVFPDSKTFVDCVPRKPLSEIQDEYAVERNEPDFDLKAFVLEHFDTPVSPTTNFQADTSRSVEEHIMALWPVLTRQPDDNKPGSSLITLPQSYIVPGGRFSEIYYWDSYFTILGLKASGRTDMVEAMANNFAYLIDSIGFIPNGNRQYYLSRSQPPYFSLIVGVAVDGNDDKLLNYLPALQREYDFWMKGKNELKNAGDASLVLFSLMMKLCLTDTGTTIRVPGQKRLKKMYTCNNNPVVMQRICTETCVLRANQVGISVPDGLSRERDWKVSAPLN